MFDQFLNTSQQLFAKNEPFAIAFVINRKVPSSGKPGDKAVIHADGTIEGWIGGGCTRGIVLKEAHLAISTGTPRVVRIAPDGDKLQQEGIHEYHMTCHSGGTVELYIEPIMPKTHLVILGKSQVAKALAQIASVGDFRVSVFANAINQNDFSTATEVVSGLEVEKIVRSHSHIVVCTQGENDEQAIANALSANPASIAFVASRKKANSVYKTLRGMGITFDQLKKIKTPAGMDIGAKTPQEVAISILAEIIKSKYEQAVEQKDGLDTAPALNNNPAIFINPVCQVPVDKATAKHVINFKEKDYYFCCDGCKVVFEKEPEKYALA